MIERCYPTFFKRDTVLEIRYLDTFFFLFNFSMLSSTHKTQLQMQIKKKFIRFCIFYSKTVAQIYLSRKLSVTVWLQFSHTLSKWPSRFHLAQLRLLQLTVTTNSVEFKLNWSLVTHSEIHRRFNCIFLLCISIFIMHIASEGVKYQVNKFQLSTRFS